MTNLVVDSGSGVVDSGITPGSSLAGFLDSCIVAVFVVGAF